VVTATEGWEVCFGQVDCLWWCPVLTSKPMSSIRRAELSNVCRYFSSPGHKMLWRFGKSAWTGSIKRYSWEGVGKPNQVFRMAV
jgi:hypothetical protein